MTGGWILEIFHLFLFSNFRNIENVKEDLDQEGRSLGPLPLPRFPMNGFGFNLLQQAAMRRQGLASDFAQDGLQAPEFNKNLFETQDSSEDIR